MDSVLGLQVGSAIFLNVAFAWLVGSWLARRWMLAAGVSKRDTEHLLGSTDIFAGALGVLAGCAGLWASAAVMGGVSLAEAKDLVWQMLTMTSIGRAGYISLGALALAIVLRAYRSTAVWREWAVLAALGVFAFVRASMGHAGENGYWAIPFAAEFVHLTAMGAWTGLVFVSAWKAMGAAVLQNDSNRMGGYLEAMSVASMAAVLAIFATGLFNSWNRVGTVDNLVGGSLYTTALLVKVALVAVALLLGGYNKFFGLALARNSAHGLARVKLALALESIVLLAVLFAAAVLTAQQPPAAM
jgi:putative copper resistance protein D